MLPERNKLLFFIVLRISHENLNIDTRDINDILYFMTLLEGLILKKNTVFVIGAGASKEVHIPIGSELKEKIVQLLNIQYDFDKRISGDPVIEHALYEHAKGKDGRPGDINPYLHEAWHIRDALTQAISIDNFIDTHKNNDKLALCGKLAIVRSILQSEQDSLLF